MKTKKMVYKALIPDSAKITGNMSTIYENWKTAVHSVIMYNKYTEIPEKE